MGGSGSPRWAGLGTDQAGLGADSDRLRRCRRGDAQKRADPWLDRAGHTPADLGGRPVCHSRPALGTAAGRLHGDGDGHASGGAGRDRRSPWPRPGQPPPVAARLGRGAQRNRGAGAMTLCWLVRHISWLSDAVSTVGRGRRAFIRSRRLGAAGSFGAPGRR